MASIFDVANYILIKLGPMSTWKLQKLCYYSQAWSLAWTERPIFDEDFEAWTNGPVCRALFHAHQGRFYVGYNDINGNPSKLTNDNRETIDAVLRSYGPIQPYELREMTHKEKPWIDARKGLSEWDAGSNIISKESIGDYYGSL